MVRSTLRWLGVSLEGVFRLQGTTNIARSGISGVLTRRHWVVLGITMLFWLFDGYETYALLLTIGPSLHELLPADALRTLPRIAAYLISITSSAGRWAASWGGSSATASAAAGR